MPNYFRKYKGFTNKNAIYAVNKDFKKYEQLK